MRRKLASEAVLPVRCDLRLIILHGEGGLSESKDMVSVLIAGNYMLYIVRDSMKHRDKERALPLLV